MPALGEILPAIGGEGPDEGIAPGGCRGFVVTRGFVVISCMVSWWSPGVSWWYCVRVVLVVLALFHYLGLYGGIRRRHQRYKEV